MTKKINVTRPNMPDLDLYVKCLKELWDNRWLTNMGSFHDRLEDKLCNYLGSSNCSLMSNGTLALIIGLKGLGLKGEVITTPFSFAATVHSIVWAGLKPVFADIEEETLNLDPEKIQDKITENTSAILPVHVFGNPCDVKYIDEIAEDNDLKVLYDAAHAFNTRINSEPVIKWGDASAISFHATKVYNTVEGGAILTENKDHYERFNSLRNFGFSKENIVTEIGLNAKMNELLAAYGLLQLDHIDEEVSKRKNIASQYHLMLNEIKGINPVRSNPGISNSYPYFPILVNRESFGRSRDELFDLLAEKQIMCRKYFHPLISDMLPYRDISSSDLFPVASRISDEILCLPIYGEMGEDQTLMICELINDLEVKK